MKAGRHASREVLLTAAEHGMPWSKEVCSCAASAQRWDMVKWLYNEQKYALPWPIAAAAAECGDVVMLEWVRKQQPTESWSADDGISIAYYAAKSGQ